MTTRLPLPSGPVRWRYEEITARIREFLDRDGVPSNMRKRFEDACNLDHSAFSHRMSGYRGQRFRVEHFGAMAEEASWPAAFPWLPWDEAEKVEAVRTLVARTR